MHQMEFRISENTILTFYHVYKPIPIYCVYVKQLCRDYVAGTLRFTRD